MGQRGAEFPGRYEGAGCTAGVFLFAGGFLFLRCWSQSLGGFVELGFDAEEFGVVAPGRPDDLDALCHYGGWGGRRTDRGRWRLSRVVICFSFDALTGAYLDGGNRYSYVQSETKLSRLRDSPATRVAATVGAQCGGEHVRCSIDASRER